MTGPVPLRSRWVDRVLLPLVLRLGLAGIGVTSLLLAPSLAPTGHLLAAVAVVGLVCWLLGPVPARRRSSR